MQEVKNNESLTIENRKRLYMTEVFSVDAFSEETLKLTVNDKKVVVSGNNLKIIAFNQTQKTLSAEGEIIQIKYEGVKTPLIKRVFK